jgi:hypothetical protein
VVANGSKNVDWLLPDGIVKLTICELKAPNGVPDSAVNIVPGAGPTTCVIPSGAILTLYALAESEKQGGKSYLRLFGNPIEEVGKFIFIYNIELDFNF